MFATTMAMYGKIIAPNANNIFQPKETGRAIQAIKHIVLSDIANKYLFLRFFILSRMGGGAVVMRYVGDVIFPQFALNSILYIGYYECLLFLLVCLRLSSTY